MLIVRVHLHILYVRSNVWMTCVLSKSTPANVVVFGSVGNTRS
jgi:hypothetical protein